MTTRRRGATALAAATFGLALSSGAGAQEMQASVFGGVHLDNVWEEVFLAPDDLEPMDVGLLGIAVGRDWASRGGRFSYGIELQAVAQFAGEDHLELNLPVFARYHPPERIPVRSLGFGIGPSYATRVPEVEVERRDESRRVLVYWTLEAEFGASDAGTTLFTRLHHRSGVFGLFDTDGASNALVLGLRRRW